MSAQYNLSLWHVNRVRLLYPVDLPQTEVLLSYRQSASVNVTYALEAHDFSPVLVVTVLNSSGKRSSLDR